MVTYFNLEIEFAGESSFRTVSGFTLLQKYDSHHTFELRVPLESVESSGSQTMNKSKSFIGQSIKFKIDSVDDNEAASTQNEFIGVVTSVAIARYGGVASDLLIRGFSPSIILDHGINTKVFAQTNLSGLVSAITSKYPFNGVRFKVNPRPNPQLAFIHQHKESTYDFLCRLANRYGQWFFFDGKEFIFGKLSGGNTVALKFGADLSDFELGISLAPTKFKTMAIDANSKVIQQTSASVEHLDQLGSFAFDQSNKFFFEEQIYNADQSVTSASDVQDLAKNRRAGIAAGLVRLSGSSVNAKIKIGGNVSVNADGSNENAASTDYGTYTVIAIKHTMDGRGHYRNNFEAISSSVDVPPPIGAISSAAFNSASTSANSFGTNTNS